MRESFGGAFMIKLILVFIVIYISFMAVAVNYAKAFRVKNGVINILEQRQFIIGDTDTIDYIDDVYLANISYNFNPNGNPNLSIMDNCYSGTFGVTDTNDQGEKYILTNKGVCITRKCSNNGCSDFHYVVESYISIEFPFFNISMTLPISGETKTISVNSNG